MNVRALGLALLMVAAPLAAQPLRARDLPAVRAGAQAGLTEARFDLGRMYRNGIGVPADKSQAYKWIALAAQGGYPPAMFTLHNMLAAGEGAPKDDIQARSWLERAAEKEDPQALQQLAQHLQTGAAGYERDPARAEQLLAVLAHAMKHQPHAD
jgi:TPR repeat protein